MRVLARVLVLLAVPMAGPALAQASGPHPYDLDSYKPSDAALLRNYGETLVAQTPLIEMRHLDPYKPSHAALLQQIGGGLPLWGVAWYPFAVPAPPQGGMTTLALFPSEDRRDEPWQQETAEDLCPCAEPAHAGPSSVATVRLPDSNDGVWIAYDGRRWVNSGRSVPMDEAAFERVGQHGEFPVYRRLGGTEDLIYLPARDGLLAPYRLKTGPN